MSRSPFRSSAQTAYRSPPAIPIRGVRYVRGPRVASSTRCGADHVAPLSRERDARSVGIPVMSYPIQMRWTDPSAATKTCGAPRSVGEGPVSTIVLSHEAPRSPLCETHRVATRLVGTSSRQTTYASCPSTATAGSALFASVWETCVSADHDPPPSNDLRRWTWRRLLFRLSA